MKIETYISALLYRYQCVTVPGFGAFLTEIQSAQLNKNTNTFYPPKKMTFFNPHLKNNDGLLANHIALCEKTSYDYAVSAIGYEILNWKKKLQDNEVLLLKNIGELSLNAEGSIVFKPADQNNFLTSSFGLSSFVSPEIKREILTQKLDDSKTENVFTEDTISSENDTEVIALKSRFPYLRYAAIFILGLSVAGSIGYPMYQQQIASQTVLVEKAVQKQVQNKIQQATFFIESPIPAVTLTVEEKKDVKPYHIVAGAFRTEKGAEKLRKILAKDGYEAECLPKSKHGLYPVIYGSFATMDEAQKIQRVLHKNENPDAWILIETLP